MGDMADLYDYMLDHDDDDGWDRAVCKYCGNAEVWWFKADAGKWRLYDEASGELHVCPQWATVHHQQEQGGKP